MNWRAKGVGGMAGDTGKLGFGMMRLPKKLARTDIKQTSQMVDEFLDAGFTYFDTAYVYVGSEEATRKALVSRHPRDSFTVATKVYPKVAPTAKAAKGQLGTSLKRLGTDYIDYFLLHSITDSDYERYDQLGLWDFAAERKAAGVVRHVGFSFHGGPQVLDRVLTQHPETEFVQLQLNYADWENPRVQSRANYEVARAHGKPIVVMEPVKGGNLANPPAKVKALFDAANPQASYASWAIRFAASLDGVLSVLSGMSNLEQMRDNLAYMRDFQPLSADEMRVIRQAQKLMGAATRIECTACGYCLEGCPQQIDIPRVFEAMNERLDGQLEAAQRHYERAVEGGGLAGDCIACGACENVCTQNLPIVDDLALCAKAFGK